MENSCVTDRFYNLLKEGYHIHGIDAQIHEQNNNEDENLKIVILFISGFNVLVNLYYPDSISYVAEFSIEDSEMPSLEVINKFNIDYRYGKLCKIEKNLILEMDWYLDPGQFHSNELKLSVDIFEELLVELKELLNMSPEGSLESEELDTDYEIDEERGGEGTIKS